nr:MAG TPA: hypothetical protein [Caudoviricetes sp.]
MSLQKWRGGNPPPLLLTRQFTYKVLFFFLVSVFKICRTIAW